MFIKGESLAQFYKEPLLRLSSDVDIIIHKNDIEKVIMLLKENEYEVQPLKPGGHHFKCFHKIYGLLEVHVSFYMDVTNDICFKNLIKFQEDYREIQIPEIGNVHVLGYTDGLLYLLIHFIKHFISFGAGIRHVMDIAFYLENYYENIDMKMIKKQLEQVGYADFLNYVLFLCSKYLNSEVSQRYIVSTHEIEQKADIILDDMERGGVFGHKDLARVDFYKIYLRERAKRKNVKGKLWKHMVSRIAPPQKGEESTICYIGKLFTLYPATMVYRGFSYLKRYILKRKVTNTENADSTLKRMELLEELGLI